MNAPLHREIPAAALDAAQALAHASDQWDRDIVRQLTDYIAIPAKSPGFDADWAAHGHIETVLRNASTQAAALRSTVSRWPWAAQSASKPGDLAGMAM